MKKEYQEPMIVIESYIAPEIMLGSDVDIPIGDEEE